MQDNVDEWMSLITQANAYMQNNQIYAAQQTYDKVLKIDPKNAFALLGKSLCYYHEGNFNLARRLAQKARDIDRNVVPQDYFEDLLSRSPTKNSSNNSSSSSPILNLLNEASYFLNKNKLDDAIRTFNKVLDSDSKNVAAIYGKSVCYYMKGDFLTAIRFAERARAIDTDSIPREYYNELKSRINDSNRSSGNRNSHNADSQNPQELLAKGLGLIRDYKYDSAISTFNQVLKLEPNNVNAIVGKAYCNYELNNVSLAKRLCDNVWRNELKGTFLKYYDIITRSNAGSSTSRRVSGSSSRRNTSNTSGNSSSRNSNSLNVKVYMAKGMGLIRNRKFNDAISVFEDVLGLDSNNVDAVVGIAYCYYSLGDVSLAKRMCNDVWRNKLKGTFLKYYDKITRGNDGNTTSRWGSGSSSGRNTSNTSGNSSSRNSLNARVKVAKGLGLIRERKFNDAISVFEDVLGLDSNNVDAVVGIAYCYYSLGDVSLAKRMCNDVWRSKLKGTFLKYYDKITRGNDGNSTSRRGSGSSSRRNTSNTSGNSSSRNSLNARVKVAKGLGLIRERKFNDAISVFEDVLGLDSNNVDAVVGIAYCYYSLGDVSLAKRMCNDVWRSKLKGTFLKYYDEITRSNSRNSTSGRRRSGSSSRQNSSTNIPSLQSALNLLIYSNYTAAKSSFEKILSKEPDNINAIVGKSYCLYKLGHVSLATRLCHNINKSDLNYQFLQLYEEMMGYSNDSNNTSSSRSSGSSYGGSGSSSGSSNNYQVKKLCDEGFKHMEKYENKDALICFKKAEKLDSNNVRALEGFAQCLYNLGYYIPSLKKYDEALSLNRNAIDYEFYTKVKNKANKLK